MDAGKIDLMLRMLPDGVSRRDFLRTAAAGAAGAAGTLAAPKRARAQTPKKGGTLVYGMEGPSDILDPQATGCWLTYRVTFQMFEGLLAEDLTRADVAIPTVVPKLAESYHGVEGRPHPDVQAAPRREVPRRHAVQRPGRRLLLGADVQEGRAALLSAGQQLHQLRGRVHHGRGGGRRVHAQDDVQQALRGVGADDAAELGRADDDQPDAGEEDGQREVRRRPGGHRALQVRGERAGRPHRARALQGVLGAAGQRGQARVPPPRRPGRARGRAAHGRGGLHPGPAARRGGGAEEGQVPGAAVATRPTSGTGT